MRSLAGVPHTNPTCERGDRLYVRNCPRLACLARASGYSVCLSRRHGGDERAVSEDPSFIRPLICQDCTTCGRTLQIGKKQNTFKRLSYP